MNISRNLLSHAILRAAVVCAIALTASPGHADTDKIPTPVENLDTKRYLGTWHQLALIPMSFQKQCVKNTTATYSMGEDGRIVVKNRCTTAKGEINDAEARARVNEDYGKASTLEVTFVKLLGMWLWLASGDYWVIDIDENYQTALVGHPELSYGWILSRTPTVGLARYKELAQTLKDQGYDTCRFEMSTTPEQSYPEQTKLCEVVAKP